MLQNINVLEQQQVPEKDQEKMISEHHNRLLLGHPEQDKTIELIQRKYTFPKMRKAVEKYIQKCTTCAKNKPARHKPYGEQQQIEAPQQAWQEITIDFIIQLPPSKDTVTGIIYDSILVVIDQLTKYALFIPWREKESADKLTKTMLKEIVSNNGILLSIISDRDKLFIFKFWNTWKIQLGTKVKLFTSYHPQTDGQTK